MNERIDIPEGEDKAKYSERFRELAKGYKFNGWIFAITDLILTMIITISYASGRSSSMDLTITIAILCVITFPFIFSAFNKGSQLISDIESERVQIITGNITKIKFEKKRGKAYRLLFLDRKQITINEKYCEEFSENDRVQIVCGVSSRIAVAAKKDPEAVS